MALRTDVYEQLEQAEARLHLVPADEAPPAEEERERVQRWQEHVREAAEAIRRADDVIEQIAGMPDLAAAERDSVIAMARSVRTEAFAVMKRLNPDQSWFWTETWQVEEREAYADIAAGRTTFHACTGDFLAALDARRAAHADA
jgi:hypothetical protein